MAMQFDISSDPILKKATDMATARALVAVSVAFGFDFTEDDIETLANLGAEHLLEIIRELPTTKKI